MKLFKIFFTAFLALVVSVTVGMISTSATLIFTDCEDNDVDEIKIGTPVIDGQLDFAYTQSLILGDLGRAPNAYGTEWPGTAEADIYFLYDSVSLYICAVVEDDDVLTKGEAFATGSNPYANDCIDLRLSLDGSATETIKVGIDAYGYACYGLAAHYDKLDYSTIVYATTYTDTCYVVEVAIPCTKSNLNMIAAGKLGFTYQLNDINADGKHQNHTTSFQGEAVKMPVFYNLSDEPAVSPADPGAYDDYAPKGSTFTVMLFPEDELAEKDGDSVLVELVLFCEYEGEELDEFGFYSFKDTIKYNKNRFELVDDSEWVEDGFEFEEVKEGEILVTAEKVTGLENGVAVCYFELQAIDTGSASLKQEDVEIRRTSSSSTKYTVTKETLTLKGVKSLSDEDDEYSISTDYDSDYGTVYLSTKSEKPGEEVWFRVVPKNGYECEEIIVYYYDDGNPCEIIYKSSIDDNGYKYYYFNMPETAVIINVDFTTISFEPATERDIKLFYDADYGFVYLNTYKAEEDTRIKICVEKFDSSYDFDIYIEDADGNTYEPILSSTKAYYYFDMPNEDVEIEVYFTGTLVSSGTTYSIVDNTDDEYGYAIMPTKAAEDAKVKIVTFPEDGYVVDKVRVYGFDTEKEYTVSDKGEYWQFIMPDEKVVVDVVFIDEEDLDNEYKIYTDDVDDAHGTVTLSATTAQYDEKVKIWVDPDSGYEIDTIEITEDKTGDTVELYGDEDDDYYYFYMPRDDVYLYVDFEESSSSSATTYDVNLSYNKDQGTVELSRSKAAKGKTVSIFPEPEEGYVVDDVKVTKSTSSSTTVKVYDDEDERDETFYYFTMPAYPVKVTVTFKLEKSNITSSGVPGDATGDGQVNPLDLIYFMRYLAKWTGYDEEKVDVNNLDLNLDGQVNPLDSVILTRHLAQWEGYETLPGKDKNPWEYTYKEYLAMTEEEQTEHMSKFESFSDFLEWYYAARTKYEKAPEDYTYEEYLQMTEEERAEHLSKFDSQSDFLEWYYTARTKYEEELKNSN